MRHMYRVFVVACALLLLPAGAFAQDDYPPDTQAAEDPNDANGEMNDEAFDENYDAEAAGYYDDFAAGEYSDDLASGDAQDLEVFGRIGVSASVFSIVSTEANKRFGVEDGLIGDKHLWTSVPITFHVRLNEHLSASAGILATLFLENELDGKVSGSLLAGIQVYAVPDWLYFGVDFALGYSRIFALISPKIGHSIKIGDKAGIYIENSFSMAFIGGFLGIWKPVIGAELYF